MHINQNIVVQVKKGIEKQSFGLDRWGSLLKFPTVILRNEIEGLGGRVLRTAKFRQKISEDTKLMENGMKATLRTKLYLTLQVCYFRPKL